MKLPFTKMHGLGNDFMVLDLINNPVTIAPEQIRAWADRRFGIGFDQLLTIEAPDDPYVDFSYRIFNLDGGEVEHCGNGARCVASFVHERGLTRKNPVLMKTVNRTLSLHIGEDRQVTVDMGKPVLEPADIPLRADAQALLYRRSVVTAAGPEELEFAALSMGNPHAVIRVEDLDKTAVTESGAALGAHPDFPEGVNVGFMQIHSETEIDLRVFERGTGVTLACGTGACAAVVAGCLQGLLSDTVKVNLPGGQLRIQWPSTDASVLMTGPTATVFEGTLEL